MIVQSLRLQNFRIHNDIEIQFDSNLTVLVGKNGVGKTSVLEAIYLESTGGLNRGNNQSVLNHFSDWYRVDMALSEELSQRVVRFDGVKRVFEVDNKKSVRLPAHSRLPIVWFDPDSLRVFTGSPSRRRDFIDQLSSQIDQSYRTTLNKYNRIILQRNNLLKKSVSQNELFAWNVMLSRLAKDIIVKRRSMIDSLNLQLENVYKKIAEKDDALSIDYDYKYDGDLSQRILRDLEQSVDRDRFLGYTTVGPHRHDITLYFNNQKLSDVASRGEIRTTILALKFIEADLVYQAFDIKPVLLLDDIFSELDDKRQIALLNEFKDNQIILTSTGLPKSIEKLDKKTKRFHVIKL